MPAKRFDGRAKAPGAAEQRVLADLVSLEEVARRASELLGEPVPVATVRGWWGRDTYGIRSAAGGYEDPPRVLWSKVRPIFGDSA